MTASELMVLLLRIPERAPIKAWDADSGQYEDVTGIVWSDDGSEVFIQTTDEPAN